MRARTKRVRTHARTHARTHTQGACQRVHINEHARERKRQCARAQPEHPLTQKGGGRQHDARAQNKHALTHTEKWGVSVIAHETSTHALPGERWGRGSVSEARAKRAPTHTEARRRGESIGLMLRLFFVSLLCFHLLLRFS